MGAELVVGGGTTTLRRPVPTVSVVMTTHRRQDMLRSTLRSLAESRGSEALDEVLVVENGSRVGSDRVCEELRDVLPTRYHFVEQASQPVAFNEGLRLARSEFLIFFDDDIEVGEATVEAYLEAVREHGAGHFFGGPVEPLYEAGPPPEWMRVGLPYSVVGFDLGPDETTSDEFLGANWAAYRSDLLREGGWPKGLGPGADRPLLGGETELQASLRASGSTGVYLPSAVIRHHVTAAQCTLTWARRRRYMQRLGWTLVDPRHSDAPSLAGAPRFLWRACIEQSLRVLWERVRHPRTDRYMSAEMRLAELWGQLEAYRALNRGQGIDEPS